MLRHLNIDEMVSLTTVWTTHPPAKAVFLSIPEIAPLHAKIVGINAELLALRPAPEQTSAIDAVVDKASEVDMVHDGLARAVSFGLEADRHHCLAHRRPQVQRAERLEAIHKALFPNGLSIVNASYLAEAGNAARVASLLEDDPSISKVLDEIPVRGDQTLLDLTRRWITTGKKLGTLEHKRDVLVARAVTAPVSAPNTVAVRGRWLRVVSQILANLELSNASPEAIETIRGPVVRASERAGLRYEPVGSYPIVTDELVEPSLES